MTDMEGVGTGLIVRARISAQHKDSPQAPPVFRIQTKVGVWSRYQLDVVQFNKTLKTCTISLTSTWATSARRETLRGQTGRLRNVAALLPAYENRVPPEPHAPRVFRAQRMTMLNQQPLNAGLTCHPLDDEGRIVMIETPFRFK